MCRLGRWGRRAQGPRSGFRGVLEVHGWDSEDISEESKDTGVSCERGIDNAQGTEAGVFESKDHTRHNSVDN